MEAYIKLTANKDGRGFTLRYRRLIKRRFILPDIYEDEKVVALSNEQAFELLYSTLTATSKRLDTTSEGSNNRQALEHLPSAKKPERYTRRNND